MFITIATAKFSRHYSVGILRLPYDDALQYQEANGRQCSPYDLIKREFGEGQAILALRPNGDFCNGRPYLQFDRQGLIDVRKHAF